jgi:hypothetical protein
MIIITILPRHVGFTCYAASKFILDVMRDRPFILKPREDSTFLLIPVTCDLAAYRHPQNLVLHNGYLHHINELGQLASWRIDCMLLILTTGGIASFLFR